MEITMEFSFVGNPLFRQTIQVFKSFDQSASNAYYQRMSVSVAYPPRSRARRRAPGLLQTRPSPKSATPSARSAAPARSVFPTS